MTLEAILGSGLFIFLLGSVFWAGATYNRISKIESDVVDLKDQIAKFLSSISDFAGIRERVDGHEKRIERLESR